MTGCLQVRSAIAFLAILVAVSAIAQQVETPNADSQRHQNVIAREQWQMKGRQMPGSAALRNRAIQQKLRIRTTRTATTAGVGGRWISLGPLPLPSDASGIGLQDYNWVSGRATAVAADPNDSSGNTIFAGGAYGGIWKSSSASSPDPASVVWTAAGDAQATLAIGSLAVQPQATNPNPSTSVVLAGTGETNSSADSYYGLGILRSADGGQTWTLISQDASGTRSFAGLGWSQISFSHSNPSLVLAASASASQGIVEGLESPVAQNRGLYYSTDAGQSWTFATVSDSGAAITPASATSVVYNASAATFYAALRFHGFYSSTDGVNWTRLASQPGPGLNTIACPPPTSLPSACPIYRGVISVVPNRSGSSGKGEMYVWYVDANDLDQGVWKSTDGGATWTQVNDTGITNCGDLFGGCGTAQGTYDLALTAVPNGTATDLYAGAINLYKCTITNAFPTCNRTGTNTFLNLTHVYGCSSIARVHPDQHAIDFAVVNGAALLYFANDGGIYRALDGYTGLTTGTCGLTNQFDSLNATLGPMTQFVSIAESATDANLIFGGTQDNGAPATAYSQSAGGWANVNAGDDGFTAVNPTNENEWLVAMPPDSASGVNIFRCINGASCHTQDFQNDQVADSNVLGGDTGAFYLPFLLDPQSSGTLLAGTCRIWRGSTSGGAFSLLSPNFETGGPGACTGTETNLVRSLAAGGPADSSSYSQVIYVGTDGEGPAIPTSRRGGHVWVTTNSDAGATAWSDVTGTINPMGFPISTIAINPADPTGKTAYVGIMGFHTPHVWQTTNAGATWTDVTANLPDAPVNSILIDPGNSSGGATLYVGTDVGVFASNTSTPNWAEVGPASGQAGFLPNVAVTSLQISNSGGLKRLRAGTYGRGIWEWNLITTPDFQVTITDNPQTVFAGQTATFSGTIWSLNGYNSSVNFSCAAVNTPPQNCSATPSSVVPSAQGAAFSVNASGVGGDYLFNLGASGTDSASVTHNFAITLHVIDFSLGLPSPSSINVIAGGNSPSVSFLVSAAGPFSGSVSLSCTGLPPGAGCQFQPSATVNPTNANAVPVTLTVTTLANTPTGAFQVTINGSTPGGPTRSQPLFLAVGAQPDYTLAIANPSLTAQVNSSAVFSGTLTAVNGYANSVAISCGSGAPSNCIASPAQLTPTSGGAAFTVTVSSSVAQSYTFNVNAVGTDSAAIAHSSTVTFTALPTQTFDFTMGTTPSSQSIAAGQTATYTVDVNPNTGTFPNNVTLSCSGLPAATTCGFNPSQIGSGSGNSVSTFTATTTAPSPRVSAAMVSFILSPLAGIFFVRRRSSQRARRPLAADLALGLLLTFVSCGGGLQGNGNSGGSGNPGTRPGTYTITITATCGTVSHTSQVSLTVTP